MNDLFFWQVILFYIVAIQEKTLLGPIFFFKSWSLIRLVASFKAFKDPALYTAANSHGDIQTSLKTCGTYRRKPAYIYMRRDIARIETEINV